MQTVGFLPGFGIWESRTRWLWTPWRLWFVGRRLSMARKPVCCVAPWRTAGSGVESFKAYVDGRFVLFTSYRVDLPVERNAVTSGGQTPPVDREGDGPLRE